jgi:hypothetical protein
MNIHCRSILRVRSDYEAGCRDMVARPLWKCCDSTAQDSLHVWMFIAALELLCSIPDLPGVRDE